MFMSSDHGLGRGLASLIPKKEDKEEKPDEEKKSEDLSAPKDEENKKEMPKETPSDKKTGSNQIVEIETEKIVPNPHQPRLSFDEEKLNDLANSIKEHGIIQPLVVSQNENGYEIIAGERRFQAAKIAGLQKVPVIIRVAEEKEKLELALAENVQRHDLNPVEEARAYKELAEEFQMNQEEIAQRIGKSRSSIANKIRLLNLPVEIQRALVGGKISEGHAKAILALENPEKQRALFDEIIKNNLTVRQTENKTKEVSVRSHTRSVSVDPELKELENKLSGALGTRVKVSRSGGGGKIMIEYYSDEELEGILAKIK
jgi:ParB family chromosome partitioning protein